MFSGEGKTSVSSPVLPGDNLCVIVISAKGAMARRRGALWGGMLREEGRFKEEKERYYDIDKKTTVHPEWKFNK